MTNFVGAQTQTSERKPKHRTSFPTTVSFLKTTHADLGTTDARIDYRIPNASRPAFSAQPGHLRLPQDNKLLMATQVVTTA